MGLWVLLVVGGSGLVGFVDKPFAKKDQNGVTNRLEKRTKIVTF